MATDTKIQWCDHTFNPWRGCTKISAGCKNCYAETMSHRNPKVLGVWGDNGTRAIAAESYWKLPLAWNREAKKANERRRVFCASLGDVFEDRPELIQPRERLRWLMFETPHLDWLLLTKRPEIAAKWYHDYLMPDNIWLGVSAENQECADQRIPILLSIPAAVRFVSYEPAIGSIDWSAWPSLDWVICGGESGPNSRPFDPAWARSLRYQCEASGVAFFMKQLGSSPIGDRLHDKKGGDISEWPEDLRIREFPQPMKAGK